MCLQKYGALALGNKVAIAALLICAATGSARAETVTVLAFGDSLTQGYGLPDGEGFVPSLQAWLDDHGRDVTLINGGVSGDTTAGGLSRVDWSLEPQVDAMILTLGGNDMLRGLPPEMTRENLDGILDIADGKGVEVLLVGLQAPGNYGPDYKAEFDSIFPDLANGHETLYAPSFFAGILPDGGTPEQAAGMMQADGIHPNAEGVDLIVEALGPSVLELVDAVDAGSN